MRAQGPVARLPSRFENLDPRFHVHLIPDRPLLNVTRSTIAAMHVAGGVRLLPVYGASGSGKTSAAMQLRSLSTEFQVFALEHDLISQGGLAQAVKREQNRRPGERACVGIIDQYEESVGDRNELVARFVGQLTSLDRSEIVQRPTLILWLTPSKEFQAALVESAREKNARLVSVDDFILQGPPRAEWAGIIDRTFEFHNAGMSLADVGFVRPQLDDAVDKSDTLGESINRVGEQLVTAFPVSNDLEQYRVIILWPVADTLSLSRVISLSDAREGYSFNWNKWYWELNLRDRAQLPHEALNLTRILVDLRVVPLPVGQMHPSFINLDAPHPALSAGALAPLARSHLAQIVQDRWDPSTYRPMAITSSDTALRAMRWYETVRRRPTDLGQRLALCLRQLGLDAQYESTIDSDFSVVRADVRVRKHPRSDLIELKAFAPRSTNGSNIRYQIRATLRKYAQLGGLLGR